MILKDSTKRSEITLNPNEGYLKVRVLALDKTICKINIVYERHY